MTTHRLKKLALILALGGVPACAGTDDVALDKSAETDAPVDGKLDGVSMVTHDALEFEDGEANDSATLASGARVHAWEFGLSGDADIRLTMSSPREGGSDLDTVMYLYRQGENGSWGRYIRRNDDSDIAPFPLLSLIEETGLEAGAYRIVIKGYSSSEVGPFSLLARCEGNGCSATPSTADCFVGLETHELEELDRYQVGQPRPILATTRVNSMLKTQILTAVRNHARLLDDNVTINSLSDVLEYVDRGSLQSWDFTDKQTDVSYIVIDFTMGDTVVGSVYRFNETTPVATLDDNQFVEASGENLCE